VSAQCSGVRVVFGDDLIELLLGVLGIGESSYATWCRTVSFLGSFTGMLMSVSSGWKNWSICSDMGFNTFFQLGTVSHI